jgi:hypothetical protein
MERWRDGLPPGVTTGDIPTQEAIDAWANERTLGLIDRFPIQMDPDLVCLLATALATKISWDVPFEVVDAAALGPSPWAASLNRVLQSPVGSVRFSGGIPPAWRNHRVPTGTDTPTPADASTVVTPVAISRQNSRCTARDGSGRPGERIGGRNARSAAHCRLESTGASGESFLPRPIAHLHHRDVATTG